jgi:hypothetical protein
MIDKFSRWLKHNAEYDLSYYLDKPQARWTIADNVRLELLYRRTLAKGCTAHCLKRQEHGDGECECGGVERQQIYLEVELGIERGGLTG